MRRWLAGGVLVLAGWLASPGAVPVYDGVGSPDEPYKYVGSDNAPTVTTVTGAVSGGASGQLQLASTESGPQVLIDLAPGAFASGGGSVTLTAEPLAGEGNPPRGEIDGNIYRVTATDAAAFQPDKAQGFLFLRAAIMTTPDPVFVHRESAGDPWVEQRTTKTGRDVLGTPFRALGDYALVRLPGSKPLGAEVGLSTGGLLFLGGGVLLLVVVTVLVLRGSRDDDDQLTNQPT